MLIEQKHARCYVDICNYYLVTSSLDGPEIFNVYDSRTSYCSIVDTRCSQVWPTVLTKLGLSIIVRTVLVQKRCVSATTSTSYQNDQSCHRSSDAVYMSYQRGENIETWDVLSGFPDPFFETSIKFSENSVYEASSPPSMLIYFRLRCTLCRLTFPRMIGALFLTSLTLI